VEGEAKRKKTAENPANFKDRPTGPTWQLKKRRGVDQNRGFRESSGCA